MGWPFSDATITGTAVANAYEVLHHQVTGGPGVANLSQVAGAHVEQIRQHFADADALLTEALARAEGSWSGAAQDAADGAVRPMGGFSAEVATLAGVVGKSVQLEADDFTDTRNRLPEPVTPTSTESVLDRGAAALFGAQTDRDVEEAAAAAAEAEGRRIYSEYGGRADGRTGGLGDYPHPPITALGAPAVQPAEVGSAGMSGPPSASAPGGGGIAASARGGSVAGAVAPPPGPGPTTGTGPATGTVPAPGQGTGAQAPGGGQGGGAGGRGGAAGLLPTPLPIGGGQGPAAAGDRWRRSTGPGMFDDNPRGARGAGPATGAGSGSRVAGGQPAGDAARPIGSGDQTGRNTAGTAGRGGAGSMGGPLAAAGNTRRGEDDREHVSPEYLVQMQDVWGEDARVAPAVIGEDDDEATQAADDAR